MPSTESQQTPSGDVHSKIRSNHLVDEKSPYLLQHAYNPVDWYPWGEEAFDKARAENKLVFLSIGYSTCHWCHVMEAESFDDDEVATLMNEAFVSIKVDREERPDIDNIYMTVAVMMNGSGGWPLNIIMTPDQKPILAATYLPKTTRFQRTGMLELIPRIQEVWQQDPEKIRDAAEQVAASLQRTSASTTGKALDTTTLEAAYQGLSSAYDPAYGGFGGAPKFPTPHKLLFLMHYWQRTGNADALEMVEKTLQAMHRGGIYDQVGFGFHRYSTDASWFAPHFEKMLYDQAMLAMAYTEAYLATGTPEYEATTWEIFTYVLGDMRDPLGGFYSAEDADSEDEEGKFYLWTEAEIRERLNPEDAEFVIERFNLTPGGNFKGESESRSNILHLDAGRDVEAERWEPIRKALFAGRELRIKPYKDDKILTDWNGLMIAALSRAAQAFDEPAYTSAAVDAAGFILDNMKDSRGRLLHRYRQGEAGIPANLNDYSFLIWGLLELYETTFDVRYLEQTIELQEQALDHYWDNSEGGFYLTPEDGEALLIRPKEIDDSAIPSGNSVAMLNMLRLGRITGDSSYDERAAELGEAFAGIVSRYPTSYTLLLSALDFAIGPSLEVVIVGQPGADDTQAMLDALRSTYVPNKVVLLRPPQQDPPIVKVAGFTERFFSMDGKATAFVCSNYYCKSPTTEIGEMIELLREK